MSTLFSIFLIIISDFCRPCLTFTILNCRIYRKTVLKAEKSSNR
ncbi:hypothetical protein RUMLAC_00110 [[Ruminococcus] lactaris ATCC 29176]|uniref:Uncharacterized protein n=1 Tax=[Ruminococcus] lactaris ATCC 29176 TaxID=471875 RepID=B5CKZ6_9FIRM|nr:hypothetical protein RUMLAC_00110 [[Ruminococcus] lactaris ATCC 29176]